VLFTTGKEINLNLMEGARGPDKGKESPPTTKNCPKGEDS